MKRDAADVLKEALALPSEDRAALVESLLNSLDPLVDGDAEARHMTSRKPSQRGAQQTLTGILHDEGVLCSGLGEVHSRTPPSGGDGDASLWW